MAERYWPLEELREEKNYQRKVTWLWPFFIVYET